MSEQTETKRVNVAIRGALHERVSWAAATVGLDIQKLTEDALELWLTRNTRLVSREAKRKARLANA